MYRFRLNGTLLTNQPDGWLEFTEAIVRNEDVKGFTFEYENDLTFVGDGYDILNRAFLENYCAELILQVDYECDGGYAQFLELLIKITDLDQNLERCTAQAKATDNGYYGMIHNNRDIPVRLSAEYSKNGVAIDPCPTVNIAFIEPVGTGFPDVYPDTRMCYRDVDALAFVLRYMTDNRITQVQSAYLDSLEFLLFLENVPMRFAFLSGVELRTANEISVEVSFACIMKSFFALHNLFWKIEGVTLILEPYEYFFQDMEIKLPLLRDLMRSTDTTKLYSKVAFGSAKSVDERFVSNTYPDPTNWGMPFVDIIAHGKQEYPLTGVCQTDVTLNLISDYVYDSNAIEKVLYESENLPAGDRPNQEFDNDVFYVQYYTKEDATPPIGTCFSAAFNLPTDPVRGWTFNPYFWHSNVITRHTIQSDLSLYQADSDDNFQAEAEAPNAYIQDFASPMVFVPVSEMTSPTANQVRDFFGAPSTIPQTWLPFPRQFPWGGFLNNSDTECTLPEASCVDPPINLQFNNDSTNGNFDPNDNWDTTGYFFECPATGVYGFELEAYINKIRDEISYEPFVDSYLPISNYAVSAMGNPVERIIHPRNIAIQMFLTVFDSSDNVISEQVIPTYDPININNQLYWEFWNLPGALASSVITTYTSPSNSSELIQAVGNSRFMFPSSIGQTWGDDYLFDRKGLIYLEQGQRLRPRIFITAYTHPTPRFAAQRVVEYGLRPGSTFKTFYVRSGGGSFAPVDPRLHRSLLYNFDKPLEHEVWQAIKANTAQGFEIGVGEDRLTKTHIGRITRKITTGETTFEMIANRDQQFL